ncbi:efflux RND transporter permease subunit [Clavibacter sepedonicus]|uniref:efflux RND transporter permease subunit n=1 Tax=Clavibacter sepedonicus TaxID=31964 RepID=UPI003DA25E18
MGKPTRLQRGYLPILAWTLKHSAVTLILAILVLGGTVALIPSMKTNFLGDSGQNTLTVSQELPSDTSLEAQDAAATKVEQALIGVEGVDTVQTSIGSDSTSLTSAFGGGGITFALTTDADTDQDAIRERVRTAVDGLTDVGDVSLAAASGGFSSSDITVEITANDSDDLKASADAVLAAVKDIPSIEQATSNLSETQPYIAVTVDRAKAAAAGLSEQAVGGIVTASRLPAAVGQVVIDEKTLSIYIQDPDAAQSLQGLRDFRIPTARGLVPLSDLATVEVADGPATVTTTGGFRSATVSATPGSDDVGFASSEVSQAVAGVQLPAGAQASLGGVASQQSDAFGQLGLAVLAAILIVYIIMVATFRSLIQPLVLLVSVPFAATGAVLLQVVTGIPLGVASIIRPPDARGHRGDQRDRPHRPREPVPDARHEPPPGHPPGGGATAPAHPHDGARDDLRAAAARDRAHRARRVHLAAARDRRDRRPAVVDRADAARAAVAVLARGARGPQDPGAPRPEAGRARAAGGRIRGDDRGRRRKLILASRPRPGGALPWCPRSASGSVLPSALDTATGPSIRADRICQSGGPVSPSHSAEGYVTR